MLDKKDLRQIKVLFIAHNSGLYGAQHSLLDLLAKLDRTLFAPYLAAPSFGPLTKEAEKLNIPTFVCDLAHWIPPKDVMGGSRLLYFRGNILSLARRIKAVAKIVKEHQINIIYTNTVTCIEGALTAKLRGIPHIWHLREAVKDNEEVVSVFSPRVVSRIVAALSDHVLFNSYCLLREYGSCAARTDTSVIHNGIELDRFRPTGAGGVSLRREVGISPEKKLVGMIGAIHPRKDQLGFVKAAAEVRRSVEGVAFLIVGGGSYEYKRRVQRLIEDLGLVDSFFFLGWRADIPNVLDALDVLVVASKQEPFGRTIIEAMAAGTPVVATRSGGPEEILIHRETGYLVPVGAPEEMAMAISSLLLDPKQAYSFGQAGRKRAERSFNATQYVSSVQKVMHHVAHQVWDS